MKSGLPPGCRCRPRQNSHSSCFQVELGNSRILPLMFINHPKKIPEIFIFNRLFLELNRLSIRCNFPEVFIFNGLFLKLNRFICNRSFLNPKPQTCNFYEPQAGNFAQPLPQPVISLNHKQVISLNPKPQPVISMNLKQVISLKFFVL
jgi:hypothetical protein